MRVIVDYGSLLMAVGAAGAALCFTLFTNWLKQRQSSYLAAWAVSMAVIIATVATFAVFSAGGAPAYGVAACLMLVWAFAISLGASEAFASGAYPTARIAGLGIGADAAMATAFVLGYDGIGFILVNLISAGLIAAAGRVFWRMRAESPSAITTIAVLHMVLAASFVLCSVVIAWTSPLNLEGPPDNWAELVNLISCVIVITGVGGLIVTVHQERIARAYRFAANTDALTGVLNRRALHDRFPQGEVPAGTAMIVFDLDDFKGVNDRHGHSFGDVVLLRFAHLLGEAVGEAGLCARLGGEEFGVILTDTGGPQAKALAEMVRLRLAGQRFPVPEGSVACTVSAGIAVSGPAGCTLDKLMRDADSALYVSKRNGRNKVTASGARWAA